jgi:hypothetical protein
LQRAQGIELKNKINGFVGKRFDVAQCAIRTQVGFPLTLESRANGMPKRSWIKISQIRTLAVFLRDFSECRLTHFKESPMKPASSILFAALVFAGCDNPVRPSSDLIIARSSNKTLQITNTSNDPVYTFAADSRTLALLDWAVCVDPIACSHVDAHDTQGIPYSSIIGQPAAGSTVVVYHWRLVPKAGGTFEADSIRALTVDLQ